MGHSRWAPPLPAGMLAQHDIALPSRLLQLQV
jgi:hypothetical protein